MKKCIVCKSLLKESLFYKDTRRKDGLYTQCKECHKKAQKKYRESENGKSIRKAWMEYNADGIKLYYKRYYQDNKEIIDIKNRKWIEEHNEESKAYKNEYRRNYAQLPRERFRSGARQRVKYAVKTGKMQKGECAYPGGVCKGRIEAHHWDYNKPLDVEWFCRKHHEIADKVQKIYNIIQKHG